MNAKITKQQARTKPKNEATKIKESTRIVIDDLKRPHRAAIVTIYFLLLENVIKNDLKTIPSQEVGSPFIME